MIEWIPTAILTLVVFAISLALFFVYTTYVIIFHEEERKCYFCGRWTRDKGYRKQDCDKCGMTTVFEEY